MAKRKPDHEHHEEHADETWLIPYSDLLTLLFTLFIVLFASSNMDKEKMGQMESAATAFAGMNGMSMSGTSSGYRASSRDMGNLLAEAQGLDLGAGVTLGMETYGLEIEMENLALVPKIQLLPEAEEKN